MSKRCTICLAFFFVGGIISLFLIPLDLYLGIFEKSELLKPILFEIAIIASASSALFFKQKLGLFLFVVSEIIRAIVDFFTFQLDPQILNSMFVSEYSYDTLYKIALICRIFFILYCVKDDLEL